MPTAPAPAWPAMRIAAWVLIGAAIVGFVVAGDVRTNWVIGDLAPERGEVALSRLATLAALAGLVLLVWHQVRTRASLPETRYRGPSVLALLVLISGLAVLIALPLRTAINRAFEGGIPDLPPVLVWTLAIPIATAIVSWLVLRTNPMPGLRLFRDERLLRKVAVGIGVGVVAQVVLLGISLALPLELRADALLDVNPAEVPGLLPGQPLWLGVLSNVVAAPVTEELFFRGIALPAWIREYGRWVALIGSSLLFGAVHFGLNPIEGLLPALPSLVVPALAGLVLGTLALRTGSLIAPVAAHATMNAMTLLAAAAVAGGAGIGPT